MIENIKDAIPDYAKDIRLNLSQILTEEGSKDLTLNQIYGIALAVAMASKSQKLFSFVEALAQPVLSTAELSAAKSAAAIMAMNNVYYRFIHLTEDKIFASLPAKLRMNVIANPGIDKATFELYCMAVSALNGCGMCMDAHARELTKNGISVYAIQSAVRIAAVFHAVSVTLQS